MTSRHLMIGLPSTGKTTFLAALWHVVESGQIDGSLQLEALEGNRSYLNGIRDRWLSCETVERTKVGSEQIVSMTLKGLAAAANATVFFPDLSGESFRLQWIERRWSAGYDRMVQEADGALVFLHPERIVEPVRIDVADPIADEIAEEVGTAAEQSAVSELQWDPSSAPTQVQMVELLQFVTAARASRGPFRIAIVISAWDLVRAEKSSPIIWLGKRLPLLAQHINANGDRFDWRVYGVSAQGGDLEKDGQVLLQEDPSTRIDIAGDGVTNTHDITEPVKWLMH